MKPYDKLKNIPQLIGHYTISVRYPAGHSRELPRISGVKIAWQCINTIVVWAADLRFVLDEVFPRLHTAGYKPYLVLASRRRSSQMELAWISADLDDQQIIIQTYQSYRRVGLLLVRGTFGTTRKI